MLNSLLNEKCQNYDQGYDVMNILPQLFGSSCVLFQNSEIVLKLREILARSISGQVEKVNCLLQTKTKPSLDAMCKAGMAQDLYQTLKVSRPKGILYLLTEMNNRVLIAEFFDNFTPKVIFVSMRE